MEWAMMGVWAVVLNSCIFIYFYKLFPLFFFSCQSYVRVEVISIQAQ